MEFVGQRRAIRPVRAAELLDQHDDDLVAGASSGNSTGTRLFSVES